MKPGSLVMFTVLTAMSSVVRSAGAEGASARQALLSWSPTEQVVDAQPAPLNNLYVRLENVSEFRQCEVDISWAPVGSVACYERVGEVFGSGTDTTFLSRGTVTPTILQDDPGRFHVTWSNSECNDASDAGLALVVQFESDGCLSQAGCFVLNTITVGNCLGVNEPADIVQRTCSLNGGCSDPGLSPARPATWGAIKALFAP